MVHDISPKLKRLLEIRRGERVVDDQQCTCLSRDRSDGCQIRDTHERVRRRLDENRACVRSNRICYSLGISGVNVGEGEPKVLKHAIKEAERAAIYVLGTDDVVAGAEQLHDRIKTPHSAGESEAVAPALERGHVPLECLSRRVLPAGVLITFMLAQRVLHVRRREVYGRHDGARQRLRSLAGVNGARAETRREVFVEDASHGQALSLRGALRGALSGALNVALKIVPATAAEEP